MKQKVNNEGILRELTSRNRFGLRHWGVSQV